MIQRIQSIWLLLASLTLICVFFLPLVTKNINDTAYSIYTTGLHEQLKGPSGTGVKVELSIVPLALNVAAVLFCFTGIFLFRNRGMQKKIILISIVLIVALSVLCGINTQQLPGGTTGMKAGAGTFFPLLAIIFSLLAIRGIRKDEQLLRSADRLR